jgi:hypothetical protein
MKVIKVAILAFVLGFIVETVPIWAIEVTPANVVLPTSLGGPFRFDLVISSSDPTGVNAAGFQCTIGVSPVGLTFDAGNSEAVVADTDYWIYGNSAGVYAQSLPGNNYRFSDSPANPLTQTLFSGDIMARYAFIWDGTEGDYTFTLNLDPSESYIRLDDFSTKEALQFNQGGYPGSSNSFTVTIPEPATIVLLGLGSLLLGRNRKFNKVV